MLDPTRHRSVSQQIYVERLPRKSYSAKGVLGPDRASRSRPKLQVEGRRGSDCLTTSLSGGRPRGPDCLTTVQVEVAAAGTDCLTTVPEWRVAAPHPEPLQGSRAETRRAEGSRRRRRQMGRPAAETPTAGWPERSPSADEGSTFARHAQQNAKACLSGESEFFEACLRTGNQGFSRACLRTGSRKFFEGRASEPGNQSSLEARLGLFGSCPKMR